MDRDIDLDHPGARGVTGVGRSVIAVVGIDRYADWPRLGNAVSDAVGVSTVFRQLGFVQVTAPLLDTAATGDAMRRLVVDDLARLSSDDSLVLFFAGHGHTVTRSIGHAQVKTGYVLPVDAAPEGQASTWLRLDAWLTDIARLPPRHILVIIDSCHSGVALSPQVKWREASPLARPLEELRRRFSRRVITSALDDQRAMDGGPYPQHSLFTGCLIEGLRGGLARDGRSMVTGSEIGVYVRNRVGTYPSSMQTPDVGAFELDDRGELIVPILPRHLESVAPTESASESAPAGAPTIPPGSSDAVGVVKHTATSEAVDVPAVADRRANPSRASDAEHDSVSSERFLDDAERKRILEGLLRNGIDDNAILERDRARRPESKVAHGRGPRIAFGELLRAPVNGLIVWGCLGLFVPLVGPIVIAYVNLKFRNAPARSRRGLRAAELLGAVGTITALCIALAIAARSYR